MANFIRPFASRSGNPTLPAESGNSPLNPIIPPVRVMPFIDPGTWRLSEYAFQFLQQLYTAVTGGDVGGTEVIVSASPPANPEDGWLWFDTISGRLFAWYNDGSSSQWVNV
jgi:hypothetical protein